MISCIKMSEGGATAILWKGKNCYSESVRNSVGDTE